MAAPAAAASRMAGPHNGEATPFWSLTSPQVLAELSVTTSGLSRAEAASRIETYASRLPRARRRRGSAELVFNQFKSPIVLILIFAAVLSAFLKDVPDAVIIIAIVTVSGLLGFWQERGAADALAKLLAIVQVKASVRRDGALVDVPADEVVPGDLVMLSAGATIPGDCLLLTSRDLFVDEASLTGETYPMEKQPGVLPEDTTLSGRSNSLFMGTHVVSGSAEAVVVHVGADTEFGRISDRLQSRQRETEFEHGVRRLGFLLMEVTLILVIAIFAANVYFQRPVIDSFLFSLALAVGLTPQLLPAIISINLAYGARRMAARKVIVKRLESIENFGSMNVLCSDKTGTLTEGVVHVHSAVDARGEESREVMRLAYLNSSFETGFTNPLDEAIRAAGGFDISAYRKLDEEPYDFVRKCLSVLVEEGGRALMVTKGALSNVLELCTKVRTSDGGAVPLGPLRADIEKTFQDLSAKGLRTLGVAYRGDVTDTRIDRGHERDMVFAGLLVLHDPPKRGASAAVAHLGSLGVTLKVITGDNAAVAASLAGQMGLSEARLLTGRELHQISDQALARRCSETDVFAEIEPNQKERVILALRKAGNVVGYIGDGINDASALHAADVSISVKNAVDVAKEAADFVLLEPGLDVLAQGVTYGRQTFANTLKYVFMATSANFGNMFSMAGASLFLPFLPLLPTQIMLTNLLTDMPEITIARDSVDAELVERPRRWNIRFIRRFMMTFGLLSSVFDYLTFATLLWMLHAGSMEFRTGWFTESVLSASLIVLVIRSRRPFWRSRPSRMLVLATGLVWLVTLSLPYSPIGRLFHFQPLPALFLAVIAGLLVLYIASAELVKHVFYRLVE
jgi:P-type Mg2+ transporter